MRVNERSRAPNVLLFLTVSAPLLTPAARLVSVVSKWRLLTNRWTLAKEINFTLVLVRFLLVNSLAENTAGTVACVAL